LTRSVTFETAALSDAVNKASRVAPTKGAAYDRSAGVLIELRPGDEHEATIKATNLEVTYLQWVDPIRVDGPPGDWRVPSGVLSGLLAGFPMGAGQTVTLTEKDNEKDALFIVAGKIKAKIRVMPDTDGFIKWVPFDMDSLVNVPGFAARVAQASWACDRATVPYTGVHIDGTSIIATDRYRLVKVPCVVPVTEPITVPLEVIGPILRNLSDAQIEATEHRLHLMPDSHTQITSGIFSVAYPNVKALMDRPLPDTLTVDRDLLVAAMQRMLVLCKGERYPLTRLTVGDGQIEVHMNVVEVGEMDDTLSVTEGASHAKFAINFTPQNLVDGLLNASVAKVTIAYDHANEHLPFHIADGNGYDSWIVPRRVSATSATEEE
jgi:DNA polymerase III sliding clamp (beta) subunit (PCNA family)